MELIVYLVNHKKFTRIIIFNIFIFVLYWYLLRLTQGIYIELATELFVFLVCYPCFFYWQSVFHRIYESSFVRFRLMSKCRYNIDLVYKLVNLILSCIYGFIVGFIILLISGSWSSGTVLAMAALNLIFIIVVYALLTAIYSHLYTIIKKGNIPIFITLFLSTIFALSLYRNRLLLYIYASLPFFMMIILLLLGVIILLTVLSKEASIKSFSIKKVFPYFIVLFIYWIQMRYMSNSTFENAITLNLRIVIIDQISTLVVYIAWFVLKVVVVTMATTIFIDYIGENYRYFKIRGIAKAWYWLILKKITRVLFITLVMQLSVIYFVRGLYPSSWNDVMVLLTSYAFIFILVQMQMLIYQYNRNPKILIYFTGTYFVIGLIAIYLEHDILMDVLLQQSFQPYIICIFVITSIVLMAVNLHVLKTRKE